MNESRRTRSNPVGNGPHENSTIARILFVNHHRDEEHRFRTVRSTSIPYWDDPQSFRGIRFGVPHGGEEYKTEEICFICNEEDGNQHELHCRTRFDVPNKREDNKIEIRMCLDNVEDWKNHEFGGGTRFGKPYERKEENSNLIRRSYQKEERNQHELETEKKNKLEQ